jgi:hypothetical protein
MSLLYGDLVRLQNAGDQTYMGGCNNSTTCGVPLTTRAGESTSPGDWTLFKIGGGAVGTPVDQNNFTLTCQYDGLPGYNGPITYCAEISPVSGGPGNMLCTGSVYINNNASSQTNLSFVNHNQTPQNVSYNIPLTIYRYPHGMMDHGGNRILVPCGVSTGGGSCPYNIGLSTDIFTTSPYSKWIFTKGTPVLPPTPVVPPTPADPTISSDMKNIILGSGIALFIVLFIIFLKTRSLILLLLLPLLIGGEFFYYFYE